ncbi:MAG: 2-oxo acid dehydrogenase subunit E2, partial [Gammaproteobacteria bacterium]|nr:2-oxo acid dehydrogenase subunit E2 [Gammaproteobacteria bacterium]
MTAEFPVAVPDIGDFEDVDVIEILVAVGDTVAKEEPLLTLESDKATMDIPAPRAGRVAEISVVVGDKVSQGSIIATLAGPGIEPTHAAETTAPNGENAPVAEAEGPRKTAPVPVTVPDIGDFEDVDVIEILVRPGDTVEAEAPLITLESDKAAMDIPAPTGGRIDEILIAVGDKVSEGHLIATIAVAAGVVRTTTTTPEVEPVTRLTVPENVAAGHSSKAYASPSIRKFARELGVDLALVRGTGRKDRIIKSDVQAFVKSAISGKQTSASARLAFADLPAVDFSKFGPIETQALTKIQRLTGQNLHRSWITAPHVTQFDEADITELEAFRKSKLADAKARGVKLTLLSFLIKAVVVVLNKYPVFNASLSTDGTAIVRKKYFHIGVAVNTERGLVVPVIRDVDQKGLYELAGEVRELSTKARDKQLKPAELQGGCFTISSLGGVGGTAFTPIINVPEVAILGV